MKNIIKLLIFFPVLAFSQTSEKQTTSLEWNAQIRNNKVILECTKGCSFSVLIFNANQEVVINQKGMIDIDKDPEEVQKSSFLISYSRDKGNIIYKGIKGVEWNNLSVSGNKYLKHVLTEKGIKTF